MRFSNAVRFVITNPAGMTATGEVFLSQPIESHDELPEAVDDINAQLLEKYPNLEHIGLQFRPLPGDP